MYHSFHPTSNIRSYQGTENVIRLDFTSIKQNLVEKLVQKYKVLNKQERNGQHFPP